MISNIGPIPVQPGDVVRDQQDSVDYVVRASALLGAGALVVYGISLYDQSLRQWTADTYEELGLRKILTNHANDAPEEVVAQLTDLFDKPGRISKIAGKADFNEALFSEKGQFFRDLLFVGSEIQEFNSRLGEMANALVGTTRRVWSAEEILHAFQGAVHPDAFDPEFLQQFADEFAFRIRAEADLNRVTIRPNAPGGPSLLRDLLLPQSFDAEDAFANTGLRQLKRSFQRQGQKPLGQQGRSLVRRVLNPELGDPILNYLGVTGESTASDRLTALVAKTMEHGGAKDSVMVVKSFLDSLVRKDTKRILDDKLPSSTLANLLDDSRLTQVIAEVTKLSHTVKKERDRSPKLRMVDREIERQLTPLKKVNLGQFTSRHQIHGAEQFYSLDANTFFYHYINGRKIKVGNKTFDLTSLAENEEARHALFGKDRTIMASSRHIIQALRRLEKDEVADLTDIVDNSAGIKSRLSGFTHAKINQIHFEGQLSTSRTRGVVGFRFKTNEFTPELLESLKDAQKDSMASYRPEVIDALARPIEGYNRLFIAKTAGGKVFADRHLEALDALVGRTAEQEQTTFYYSYLSHEKMRDFLSGHVNPSNLLAEPLLPFGDEGMVGRWRQQFASVDVGAADPTHRILQTVESIQGVELTVENGFRRGYQFGKMAFVSIKNLDGTGVVRAIGTDLGSAGNAIEQQLRRADMLLDPDATLPFLDEYGQTIHRKPRIAFLDLETDPASKKIREISIATTEDLQRLLELTDPMQEDFRGMTASKARQRLIEIKEANGIGDALTFKRVAKNASTETRLKNLTEVLDRLSGFDQVWAQSTNDYRFLLDELNDIAKSGKLSGEAYTIYRDTILDIAEKNGVTAETIPQLTGHLKLGNSSQPFATAQYLGRGEFHGALFDNLDAYRLQTTVYKDEYMRIRQGMEVLDLEHNPLTVVFRNSRLSDIDHQKIQILGMENMMDQTTGQTLTQMTYRNAHGDLRVLKGTPAQLGRAVGEFAEEPIAGQTLQQFLDHHLSDRIVKQATKNLEDRVRRMMNEMNPLSDGIYDAGQLFALKGPAIVQPRGAKVFRAWYLASKVYSEFREQVGHNQTSDEIEKIAGRFVGINNRAEFQALMDRYGIKLNMSDELMSATAEDVASTLSSLTDVGEAAGVRTMFERLGVAGDKLMALTLNEATLDKFDATILHVFADANRSIEKAQEGIHFSLRMPGIQNKLRAKTLITEEMSQDPTHAVNQFVSEMISYAALDPNSKAGLAAKEALESAGVKDLEGVLEGVLRHATRNGWSRDSRRFLSDQNFAQVMNFGFSEDFTDIAGEAGTQFLRGYADLPDLFARTFTDRANQITDEGEKTRVSRLAEAVHGKIAALQAELSEGDKDIAAFMGHAVKEEVQRFLNDGDPAANIHLLTTDIEVFNVADQLSDLATVEHAIRTVNEEFDDPDIMERMNEALASSDIKLAVQKLKKQAEGDIHQDAMAEAVQLSTAAEQVVKGAMMEAGMEATQATTKNAEVELMHRAVGQATLGFQKEGLVEAVHGATLGVNPFRTAKLVGNITKPLMAIAGAAALLAAANPPIDENYTGGLRSKQHVNINDPVNRFSEIPGSSSSLGPVFTGQEQPFKLDINIRGLAQSEEQKQLLIDRVYDTLTERTEYFAKRNDIREQRMQSFRQPAVDILRANV